MQFELAATDAGRTRALPGGPSYREASGNAELSDADCENPRDVRPAPIAASLEVVPWLILRFDVTLRFHPNPKS